MPDVTILHVVNREAEETALYPLISIGIVMFCNKQKTVYFEVVLKHIWVLL